jgi:hypothetical protein
MKKKVLIVAAVLIVGVTAFVLMFPNQQASNKATLMGHPMEHATPQGPPRIPAHFTDAKNLGVLPPTLPPEQFFGPAREAYQVAKEIPETLAMLPCYCYCDETAGHKSLHSCYESEHSSHCSTCVNEALMAYRLQKKEGLSPEQIRDRIIAEYSKKE